MNRGIVLGDLWGIEEGIWVQLWSGVLGAIVSAGVAALVAVIVLTQSNSHQKDLADRALVKQEEIGNEQLAEQRKEAEQLRRNSVLVDLLGAASGFQGAFDEGVEAVDKQLRLFEAHGYRWELEGRNFDTDFEMLQWGNVLWEPAIALAKIKSAPPHLRKKWVAFLRDAETAFQASCVGLGFAGDGQVSAVQERMRERRRELARQWESLMEELDDDIQRKADVAFGNL